MAWTVPEFSKSQVDKAGRILVARRPSFVDEYDQWWDWNQDFQGALIAINNWRSSHSFPLNTMQVGLRRLVRQITSRPLVAQRIKRLSSIELKLTRFRSMQLSQMQDIGGCRAIVSNVSQVRSLVKQYRRSRMNHEHYDTDDYISAPQSTGYRGVHLKYRYHSDSHSEYNGLRIEIQLRTLLQHAWATAVEIVGTMSKQALKSSQGEPEWLRFFSLMGSALARREKTSSVPETPSTAQKLKAELKSYANILHVRDRLMAYGEAIQTINEDTRNAHYYLLRLEPEKGKVTVTGFKSGELKRASEQYLKVEESIKSAAASDAVLVSVDRIENLQRAYPNYFLDTALFVEALEEALKR